MAKLEHRASRIFDHLNNYRFHLFDVSFVAPAVFNISYGFARITMPEISVEMKEVKEGTSEYKHYIPLSAGVGQITLERGVSVFNQDFYPWVKRVIAGAPAVRRNLMLVQFSEASLAGAQNVGLGPKKDAMGVLSVIGNQVFNFGDLFARVPAKAWMLYECLPVSYKAGSDLDALGNEISMSQLTLQPHMIEELSLGV